MSVTGKVPKLINDLLYLYFEQAGSMSRLNRIDLNVGNTYIHEFGKFKQAWNCMSKGHYILTEAKIKGGGRCDVVCLTERLCYEIVESEKEESILAKEEFYPFEIVGGKVKKKEINLPENFQKLVEKYDLK